MMYSLVSGTGAGSAATDLPPPQAASSGDRNTPASTARRATRMTGAAGAVRLVGAEGVEPPASAG